MMTWYREGVRLTHLPTGTVATSRGCGPRGRGNAILWHHRQAMALLKAKLGI